MKIIQELKQEHVVKDFHLVFQPQINTERNELIGLEALIRWSSSNLGAVSPSEFIPIAEINDSLDFVTTWVLSESFRTMRYWLDTDYAFKRLSVNVSLSNLKSPNFRSCLLDLCSEYDVDPSYLGLEITERQPLYLSSHIKGVLSDLKRDGFSIILDDFGSGFSNFDLLDVFDVSIIKIDKVLIDNICVKEFQLILEGILGIAQTKDIDVIVEGVESNEQLTVLKSIGLHLIQGYYFSKPLLKEDVILFTV